MKLTKDYLFARINSLKTDLPVYKRTARIHKGTELGEHFKSIYNYDKKLLKDMIETLAILNILPRGTIKKFYKK